MKTVKKICIFVLAVLTLALARADRAHLVAAQNQEHHAGLVLQFADGSVRQYCLTFAGESISGLDLLLKTGLDVKIEAFGGMGGAVCKIDHDGCDYPAQTCWCQSYGPGGVYWTYHHLRGGQWKSSVTGAGTYKVHDGDVEGWAWSSGAGPTLLTFEQICGSVPSEVISTAQPATATPIATPQPQATATPHPRPTQTKRPTTRSTPTQATIAAVATQPGLVSTPIVTVSQATPTHTTTSTSTPPPTDTAMPTLTWTPVATPTETVTLTPSAATTSDDKQASARTIAIVVGLGAALAFALWRVLLMSRPDNRSGHVD